MNTHTCACVYTTTCRGVAFFSDVEAKMHFQASDTLTKDASSMLIGVALDAQGLFCTVEELSKVHVFPHG